MSYATIEAAVITIIRLHADYDDTNCRSGDTSPVKSGLERIVAVSYGGLTGNRDITIRAEEYTWNVRVDLYIPYRGKIQDMESTLASERQKVIDQVNKYPLLNATSGVMRAKWLNGAIPEILTSKSAYRGQRLLLEVKETVTPARVE